MRRIGMSEWSRAEPRWGSAGLLIRIPGVARSSQPRARGCDPVGVGAPRAMPKYACLKELGL
jgi:hypothetical protein